MCIRDICGHLSITSLLSKRQLALLQLFITQMSRPSLTWSFLAMAAFKPARMYIHRQSEDSFLKAELSVILAIAIIMDPRNPENEELDEWICLSEELLKALQGQNVLAKNALQHIEVIKKRTELVLCLTGHSWKPDGYGPDKPQKSCLRPSFAMDPLQRIERATRVLSQPQPTMADLLGHELAADPVWTTLRPGVYAGHFPGIESLSGKSNPPVYVFMRLSE